MGDEEFDDDVEYVPKKTKIQARSVARGLCTMVLVVGGLYMVNQGWGDMSWSSTGFIMLCMGSFVMNYRARQKTKLKQVFTLLKCNDPACGIKELREFKEGDYVFKVIGPCSKCDAGMLSIDQIYAVKTNKEDGIRLAPGRGFGVPGDVA